MNLSDKLFEESPMTTLSNAALFPSLSSSDDDNADSGMQAMQFSMGPTGETGVANHVPPLDPSILDGVRLMSSSTSYPLSSPLAAPSAFQATAEQSTNGGAFNLGSSFVSPVPSPTSRPVIQLGAPANIYASIAGPPLYAKPLVFRQFLKQKQVPLHIAQEESAGVFVGQLPSSYSEDDIEALLKAIGSARGHVVQVRDVKCHNRDRTCAFIMINAGALAAVLSFTKRILCDVSCVWVVEPNQAAQLPLFVQQMPREQLRGVPKAALVLEKLMPQAKPRYGNGSPTHHNSPQHQQTQPAGRDGASGATTVPFNPLPTIRMNGGPKQTQVPYFTSQLPLTYQPAFGQALITPTGIPLAPSNGYNATGGMPTLFNGAVTSMSPLYALPTMQSVDTTNQVFMPTSQCATAGTMPNAQSCGGLPLVCGNPLGSSAQLPTAVSLTPILQFARCSCGQKLHLAQFPHQAGCISCHNEVVANSVAYWCPIGHVVVCSSCGLKVSHMASTEAAMAAGSRRGSAANMPYEGGSGHCAVPMEPSAPGYGN